MFVTNNIINPISKEIDESTKFINYNLRKASTILLTAEEL